MIKMNASMTRYHSPSPSDLFSLFSLSHDGNNFRRARGVLSLSLSSRRMSQGEARGVSPLLLLFFLLLSSSLPRSLLLSPSLFVFPLSLAVSLFPSLSLSRQNFRREERQEEKPLSRNFCLSSPSLSLSPRVSLLFCPFSLFAGLQV